MTMVHVPVGHVTASHVVKEVTFTCSNCRHSARARVVGVGEGAQSFLNAEGTAEERSQKDAVDDVSRTLALIPCPRCGKRTSAGIAQFALRFFFYAAFGTAICLAVCCTPTWFDVNMSDGDKAMLMHATPYLVVPVLILTAVGARFSWNRIPAKLTWLDGS